MTVTWCLAVILSLSFVNASGTFLGTQKIRETVELAQDGDSYTAVAFSDSVARGMRASRDS